MKKIFFSVLTFLLAFFGNLYAKARINKNDVESNQNLVHHTFIENAIEGSRQHTSHISHNSHYSCAFVKDSVVDSLSIDKTIIVKKYVEKQIVQRFPICNNYKIKTSICFLNEFNKKTFLIPPKVLKIRIKFDDGANVNMFYLFIPLDENYNKIFIHESNKKKHKHLVRRKKKWMYDLIEQVK